MLNWVLVLQNTSKEITLIKAINQKLPPSLYQNTGYKLSIFLRCSTDAVVLFDYEYLLSTFVKTQFVYCPYIFIV